MLGQMRHSSVLILPARFTDVSVHLKYDPCPYRSKQHPIYSILQLLCRPSFVGHGYFMEQSIKTFRTVWLNWLYLTESLHVIWTFVLSWYLNLN